MPYISLNLFLESIMIGNTVNSRLKKTFPQSLRLEIQRISSNRDEIQIESM